MFGLFCIFDDVKIIKDVFDNLDFDFNVKNVFYLFLFEKIVCMYWGVIDNGFVSFVEV